MKNNKSMYSIIGLVFTLFTIVQIFYFANIKIVPTTILTSEQFIQLVILFVEAVITIGLITLLVYLLPTLCILKLSTLFVHLKSVNVVIKNNVEYIQQNVAFYNSKTYRKLQVIRC